MVELINGDCLEILKNIPDNSIDMILTDPPYGTTACKWDTIIPLDVMWKELKRVIKPRSTIGLFCAQPFTSTLIHSNIKNYKHHWVWIKNTKTGFQVAKYRPMMKTEEFITFYGGKYYPQMIKREKPLKYNLASKQSRSNPLSSYKDGTVVSEYSYPENTLFYKVERGFHPTQKPVPLLEYLIKTYTLEGDTVLDFTMGSGSTGVACVNINRNFIGIELDEKYYEIAKERIYGITKN